MEMKLEESLTKNLPPATCTTGVLHLKWNTIFRFLKVYIQVTSH